MTNGWNWRGLVDKQTYSILATHVKTAALNLRVINTLAVGPSLFWPRHARSTSHAMCLIKCSSVTTIMYPQWKQRKRHCLLTSSNASYVLQQQSVSLPYYIHTEVHKRSGSWKDKDVFRQFKRKFMRTLYLFFQAQHCWEQPENLLVGSSAGKP